jgi:hypothetical protein
MLNLSERRFPVCNVDRWFVDVHLTVPYNDKKYLNDHESNLCLISAGLGNIRPFLD